MLFVLVLCVTHFRLVLQAVASSAATEPHVSKKRVDELKADCRLILHSIAEFRKKVEIFKKSGAQQSASVSAGQSITDKNSWLLDMLLSYRNADIEFDTDIWAPFKQLLDNPRLIQTCFAEARDHIGSLFLF
jgi:hypothetical protein